jgi:hypothetical protein
VCDAVAGALGAEADVLGAVDRDDGATAAGAADECWPPEAVDEQAVSAPVSTPVQAIKRRTLRDGSTGNLSWSELHSKVAHRP